MLERRAAVIVALPPMSSFGTQSLAHAERCDVASCETDCADACAHRCLATATAVAAVTPGSRLVANAARNVMAGADAVSVIFSVTAVACSPTTVGSCLVVSGTNVELHDTSPAVGSDVSGTHTPAAAGHVGTIGVIVQRPLGPKFVAVTVTTMRCRVAR